MKYLLLTRLIIFGVFLTFKLFSQEDYVIKSYDYLNFQFKGHIEGKDIYQYNPMFGSNSKLGERFNLYYSVRSSNNKVDFYFYRKYKNYVYYVYEKRKLFGKSNPDSIFLSKGNSEVISIKKIGEMNFYRNTHYLTQEEYFYFSTEIRDIDYLARIDLKQENPKMEVLPIKGRKPIIYNGWMFYEIDYMSPKYSDPPDAIYRVKIGDWRNPELIVNDVYFGGAVINENLISFRVYEKEKIRDVTYNILENSYVEIDIAPLIKYKGNIYQNTLCKDEKTGKTQICYTDVPELPDKFPHKLERQVEPNHNYLYLPHTQKLFTGTFITDSLLFFAGKKELQKLTKEQLRKLRNAFYAREGYDYDSEDLKSFFSQFKWYNKTLEIRKVNKLKNEDIYLPPADMARVKLILEVEELK